MRSEARTTRIENFDDAELDDVHFLGKRLLLEPVSPTSRRGNRAQSRGKQPATSDGLADADDPAVLVRILESSETGCRWLLEHWQELRTQLESDSCWQSHDRLKLIRLLGRRLADAPSDRLVAQIMVASHALNPVVKSPFHELLEDKPILEVDRARHELRARWRDLLRHRDPAKCREILIGLVDQAIACLNAKLEVYEENADEHAERTVARLGVDNTPDGRRIDEYQLKCMRAFERGVDMFRKHQKKVKSERPALRVDDLRPIPEYRRPRIDVPRPPAQETAASDAAPTGWFGREASQPHEPKQSIDSPPLPEAPAGPEPENRTNEAKVDENVIITQNEEPVAVAANSGVDSGLDKPEKQECGPSADVSASSPEAADIPRPQDTRAGDSDVVTLRQSEPPDGDAVVPVDSNTQSVIDAAPNGESRRKRASDGNWDPPSSSVNGQLAARERTSRLLQS
jgi:hypothetical protein